LTPASGFGTLGPVRIPDSMPAAVYRGKNAISVETRPVPEPGPGEVLIAVSHCGVCGSDLHFVIEGWGEPGVIGGHEYAGLVAALGQSVTDWAVGDPVVGGAMVGCRECVSCRAGRPSLCSGRSSPGIGDFQGAFAGFVTCPAAELVRVPEGLPLRTAALTEPLAVALHGITAAAVAPGQRALVTGAGPIGLLTVAALRSRGVDDVIVSEPAPLRRERARAVGAKETVAPEQLEGPRMPFDLVDQPFDAALECSGQAEAFATALANLDRGGRLVIVGAGVQRPRLDQLRVLLNEVVVTGAYNYDAGGFHEAVGLLASGALPTDLLIEPDDVPLSGLLDAMHRLAAGELAGKVLVVPEKGTP
jgi:threonine dehydrogenase-like Zn-dependent dehydrogenase